MMNRSYKRSVARRRLALLLGAYLIMLGVLSQPAEAAPGGNPGPGPYESFDPAGSTEDNQCIFPSGRDVNVVLGVSEQIVTGVFCYEVDAGEFWIPVSGWTVELSYVAAPEGFVPQGETPLEDFLAKFEGVTYLVDEGTPQERRYWYPAGDVLAIIDTGALFPTAPRPELPFINAIAKLPPLPVGEHTVTVLWRMSELHCDGIGADVTENCLQAGDTWMGPTRVREFYVIPRDEAEN